MKKFLIHLCIIAIPILASVAIINYYIDPAYIFHNRNLTTNVSKILLSNQGVKGLSNCDERALQKEIIENMNSCPNTIVLGSSRGMLINCLNYNDSSLFNNCVSGAKLEDIMAIYELYSERNWNPSNVIIELSPFIFNGKNSDTRYKTIKEQYDNCISKINYNDNDKNIKVKLFDDKLLELISLSYFKNSITSLRTSKDNISATNDSIDNKYTIKKPDGSITYSIEYEQKLITQKDISDALSYGNINNMKKLDKNIQQNFELFISYLQNLNTNIVFFITPLPSEVYSQNNIFSKIEIYLNDYAKKKNIKVLGSYDPIRNNLTTTDFHDGLHPKQNVYDNIINTPYK